MPKHLLQQMQQIALAQGEHEQHARLLLDDCRGKKGQDETTAAAQEQAGESGGVR
jgi:hypothetical protein